MTDNKTVLANRQKIVWELRQARIEKNISQQELADRLGTKRSNICRIERGRQNISLDMLFRIAAVLEKTVSVFFYDESDSSVKMG